MLILDSGAVSQLAERSRRSLALIVALREEGLWPRRYLRWFSWRRDANENRFLKTCDISDAIPESLARRAALLRRLAGRGSAVDALVVALAEPGGTVLTSDPDDLEALSA